ncbi:GTP cyclohydrolase 1 [Cryptococcus depauperatus CBS 7841]|uniref:GTP cyclohydrolase 1 n=1 Tax=Cryptococcus depauperatus CBS 7841 TaxID=1295531 RepID=A0AAJ8M427_9TREE
MHEPGEWCGDGCVREYEASGKKRGHKLLACHPLSRATRLFIPAMLPKQLRNFLSSSASPRSSYQASCSRHEEAIRPRVVAVVMEASYMFMSMRSVQKPSAITVTSTMLGCFRQQQKTIEEFLTLIQTPSISRH